MNEIGPREFLSQALRKPVVDVRSPSEYAQGHIPGAINLHLFTDEERARIGTMYKMIGRSRAFDMGLDIVGPKMSGFVQAARKFAPGKQILVHCWRGGMRSASMSWLLETAGFSINVLKGGYKAYRSYIRENLVTGRKFIILGGLTGSGKTLWLKKLAESGEAIVDLERLANHRGSVFGGIGLGAQPTNEQFENNLFHDLQSYHQDQVIWLEDESRQIGRIFMPEPFFLAMTTSSLIRIKVSDELRIKVIGDEYAGLDPERLAASVRQISKRLGGLVTSQCLELLENGDFAGVVRLLLPYYDKTYSHSLQMRNRQEIIDLDLVDYDPEKYAGKLIEKRLSLIQYPQG
ncbi:MAG: tRNA 2-selenouridine(34) synthase MnmH [Porphyromonadaceae bacterium]|nr:MAG: tRNA 2-selenouridine(34) synthase MnmH [Porphyromonadaceae bacterium]